ncbi:hypothetical protein BJ508DRAFT_377179 [Ascobolus immersus RN42]|uniref:Uncharacterized protein n=1 Tax=Ascobolus immersus RN42 TaxID=1160509 RepID=A0A3N4I2I3_ASCIM|nr:hypothetical protein BJ508DRAFT_377179 [Ascobolus immersus RN42]
MTSILDLPNELKLNILLLCQLTDHSLFNICIAIPDFNDVYLAYESLIQRKLQEEEDFVESVQLLDRFRLNESGMGYISLQTFANIHNYQDSYEYNEKKEVIRCIVAEDIIQLRKKFTVKPGVIRNKHELEFISKVHKYVDWMYKQTRNVGCRTPDQTLDFVLGDIEDDENETAGRAMRPRWDIKLEDDAEEVRARNRRGLIQFLILTTNFHSRRVMRARNDKVEAEIRRTEAEARWKAAFEERIGLTDTDRFHGSWETTPKTNCKVIYDYTYARTLSLSDLATVISVAVPITASFYRANSVSSADNCDGLYSCRFIRTEIYERTGIEVNGKEMFHDPQQVWVTGWNEPSGFVFRPEVDNELFLKLTSVTDGGAWVDDYKAKLEQLEDAAIRHPHSWDLSRHPYHGFFEHELYTTTGLSELPTSTERDGVATGTVVKVPMLVQRFWQLHFSSRREEEQVETRRILGLYMKGCTFYTSNAAVS